MNRHVIFKYVNLWMEAALTETIEEEDDYRIQLAEVWEDEMTQSERDAIKEFVAPFMHRFWYNEEDRQLMNELKDFFL